MSKRGDTCNEKCPECKRNLVVVNPNQACCPMGHGKLIQKFSVNVISKKKSKI